MHCFRHYVCLFAALLACAGCAEKPQIRSYTVTPAVTKEQPAKSEGKQGPPGLMLGGILLEEDRAWFFKATGRLPEMAEQRENFRAFLQSVRVDADAEVPQWQLPEGWEVDERPRQMRLATIKIPLGADTAELAVSRLDGQQSLLDNVNRWRGQMGLKPIDAAAADSLPKVEAGDKTIYLIDLEGSLPAAGGGMRGPFSGS